MGCDKNYNFWLGKGSKIKLIIFAEFSANVGGGYPPSVKIIGGTLRHFTQICVGSPCPYFVPYLIITS